MTFTLRGPVVIDPFTTLPPVTVDPFTVMDALTLTPFEALPPVVLTAGVSYYDQLTESADYPGLWS